MIKRIFIFAVLSIISCQLSFICAQSMSDNQVIDFVTKQQAKGDNQATIVQKLLQKGVTVQQLKRIRKNMEAKQEQLGAVDISGTNSLVSTSRMRTNRQLEGEAYQQQNNYMVQSEVRGKNGQKYYTNEERLQQMNGEIGFLDIDSLLYYKNMFGNTEDQVFGHNLFNNSEITFQPNMNIATPSNYYLGAGDAVIIDVWGASQETFESVISPDGTVTIEGVGPIKLAGMTVAQAQTALSSRLGRYYSGSKVSLSVGETRSIIVQVMGEVKVPGTYTLSSLSTAFNAL
jgi:hypothetical protein